MLEVLYWFSKRRICILIDCSSLVPLLLSFLCSDDALSNELGNGICHLVWDFFLPPREDLAKSFFW